MDIHHNTDTSVDLNDLATTNRPPSDEEAASMAKKIADLKEKYLAVTGRVYDSNRNDDEEIAQQCASSIRWHQSLISCIRSFPTELLQRIFFHTVFEPVKGGWGAAEKVEHNEIELVRLCLVSRRWRDVAIGHCILWTVLPSIELNPYQSRRYLARFGEEISPETHPSLYIGTRENMEWRVSLLTKRLAQYEHHLARSGLLPLTVSWECRDEESYRGNNREGLDRWIELTLGTLMACCDRWGDASFTMPDRALRHFSTVRGKLPNLRRLNLSVFGVFGDFNAAPLPTVDYFSDAPLLRYANIQSAILHGLPIQLPLRSLEEITTVWHPHTPSFYQSVLESGSPNMRRFVVTWASHQPPVQAPSFPCTLTNLKDLIFEGLDSAVENSFANHLAMVTLPALASFRVSFRDHDSISHQLLKELAGLVRRSGCSLRNLDLGLPLPASNDDPRSESAFELLSVCPELTSVSLASIDTEGLRRLILDPSAPFPMLPNLAVLSLHYGASGVTSMTGGFLDLAAPLMDVFLSHTAGRENGQVLRQVSLSGYEWNDIHTGLVRWEMEAFQQGRFFENCPNPVTAIVDCYSVFDSLCRIARRPLISKGLTCSRARDHETFLMEVLEHWESVDSIDFNNTNSSLVTRMEVIKCVKRLQNHAKQCGKGDDELNEYFDASVEALLEKWKPFVIRDAQACPYRWSFMQDPILLKWDPVDDGESLWRSLLEVQDSDSSQYCYNGPRILA